MQDDLPPPRSGTFVVARTRREQSECDAVLERQERFVLGVGGRVSWMWGEGDMQAYAECAADIYIDKAGALTTSELHIPIRYFVGVSDDIDSHLQRLNVNHLWKFSEEKIMGNGSEQEELLTQMLCHGFNEVRGRDFTCSGDLSSSDLLRVKKLITESGQLCHHCGDAATHFSSFDNLEHLYVMSKKCTVKEPYRQQNWLHQLEKLLDRALVDEMRREHLKIAEAEAAKVEAEAAEAEAVKALIAATRKRKIDELTPVARAALIFRPYHGFRRPDCAVPEETIW